MSVVDVPPGPPGGAPEPQDANKSRHGPWLRLAGYGAGVLAVVALSAAIGWYFNVASLVSTIFASVAAIAAVIALDLARRTLHEARITTGLQRRTVDATVGVADRIDATGTTLGKILVEAEAARELERLAQVAPQLNIVIGLRKQVSNRAPRPKLDYQLNIDFTEGKALLAGYLAALPPDQLPACRVIADPSDARIADPQCEADALEELKQAFTSAIARLK